MPGTLPQLFDGARELSSFKGEAEAAVAVVRERLPGAVLFKQDIGTQTDAGALARFGVLAHPLYLPFRIEVHIGTRIQGVKQPIAALDRPVENDFLGSEAALEGPGVLFIGNDFGIAALVAGHFQDPRERGWSSRSRPRSRGATSDPPGRGESR